MRRPDGRRIIGCERARRAGGRALIAIATLLIATGAASAQDRSLSQDFPLRLDDGFPTATGEAAARFSARAVVPRRGPDRVDGPATLEVGVAPRTQLSLGMQWSSKPGEVHAGDVEAAGRYQLWVQEDGLLPYLAAQLAVTAPTGVDSRAWSFEVKGLATRAIDTNLFVHVNAAGVVVDRVDEDVRRLRYRLAAGPSWIVPYFATLMLAGDVYAEQGFGRREATTVGVELGFRQRIVASVDWHGAVGTELAGPGTRAALTVTTGLSFSFTLPGW